MRQFIKGIVLLAGAILFCAWINPPVKAIKKAEWLIGVWENKTPKGSVYESWQKLNDFEMRGMAYMLNDKDTIVFENVRLVQEDDGLYYIPVVKNQNNGLPVRFLASKLTKNQLVFENSAHDFPQIIRYTRIDEQSLVAEISGKQNGVERKQSFPMKRVE